MGSGPFGLPSFRHLLSHPDVSLSVVSQPDRPSGRGKKMTPTPVAAVTPSGVPLLKFPSVNAPEALETLRKIGMDIMVVCDFGQILKQPVLDLPRLGPYNIHGSLLPAFRGAAPVQRAILDGAKSTGVTILRVELRCDAGPIVSQTETQIAPDENYGSLHERLSAMAVPLLEKFLDQIVAGRVPPSVPQDESRATMAPKIRKEESRLSFDQPAEEVLRRIRAFSPTPGAYALLKGRRVKVLDACRADSECRTAPGVIGRTPDGKWLTVSCAHGELIRIETIQPEGGREMSAREFLNGNPDAIGAALN